MSLSNTALSAIQKAGATVFEADAELKNAVNEYALRVNAAIASNPYNLGNDALFENWKVIARLSQTMTGIEEELKKVYHIAAELSADDQPLLVQVSALSAPTVASESIIPSASDITPTDVVIKKHKKSSQPTGNAAKLLTRLESLLTSKKFTTISQTTVGRDIGIPLGSMTAAIKQLQESGRIIAGPAGSYKLAKLR